MELEQDHSRLCEMGMRPQLSMEWERDHSNVWNGSVITKILTWLLSRVEVCLEEGEGLVGVSPGRVEYLVSHKLACCTVQFKQPWSIVMKS